MTQLFTIIIGLFAVVNPIGAVPVFVSLTQKDTKSWKRNQALKGAIGMVSILVAFFLAGTYILNFFGISLNGIQVAGGLIILQSGYTMFKSRKEEENKVKFPSKKGLPERSSGNDISFSPLAMPILSGPGSIAFVIGLASSHQLWDYAFGITGILCVGLITFLVLLLSPSLVKIMGEKGMDKVSKITGFITMAVGVQMVLNALQQFFSV